MSQIDNFLTNGPQPDGGSQPKAPKTDAPKAASEVDSFLSDAPAPARGFGGWARDVAAWGVKGAIAVPEAAVGLADIATGGKVGKFLENEGGAVGFRPKQAKEIVNDWHSDATKEAQQKFQEADGIVDKATVAVQNPSLVAGAIVESLPSMAAGGVAARGALTAAKAGYLGKAAAAGAETVKGAAIAGGVGEGAVMAGSQASAIRQETDDGELTAGQAGMAAGTGVIGGLLGYGGAKLAQHLGIGNVETMLAQGTKGLAKEHADTATTAATNQLTGELAKSIPRQVIEGALVEGVFEELPQSVTETVMQNLALDKPWTDGLDEAVVMGILTGGAMGAGAAGYHGYTAPTAKKQDPSQAGAAPAAPQGAPAAEQGPALALPAPTITVGADGQAMTATDRNARMQRIASGDVVDVTPVRETLRPSEAMGLRADAGGLEGAAALAVDSGASTAVQPQQYIDPADLPDAGMDWQSPAMASTGQEINYDDLSPLEQELYDWEMTQQNAPDEAFASLAALDDSDIPFFDQASNVSDEDFLRAMGASDEEITNAIATSNQPRGAQGSAAGASQTQANDAGGTGARAGQGQSTGQVTQPAQDIGARIAQLDAEAEAADAEARDWASRTYKANGKDLPEYAAQGGPADVGEANEQRRLKAIADAKGRAAAARAEAQALRDQGNAQAQQAAKAPAATQAAPTPAPKPASVADLAAISRKQIPDMTDSELVALASSTAPTHSRYQKLQKAIQTRGLQAQAATNQGAKSNGAQTPQAQQASTQQPAAGAAAGQAVNRVPAATAAQAAGPAAKQGAVNGGATTGNNGPQASQQGAAGSQEAIAAIAQEGNARREAERARKLEASERWTRMTTAERQAAATNAKGLNAIQKKNVHTKPWADLSEKVRASLLDVVAPVEQPTSATANLMQAAQSSGKLVMATVGDKKPATTNEQQPPKSSRRLSVWDEAAQDDNAATLNRVQELVDSGRMGLDEANATVERAIRASTIARDKGIVADYLGEAVARKTGAAYDYASTIDQFDGLDGMSLKDARAEHAKRMAARDAQANAPAIEAAAAQAATSPTNDTPAPTEAQKEAGNYKKGHVRLHGLEIAIENPAGTQRNPAWPALKNHYGYFKGSVGADKDHVDVFLTDKAEDASLPVFVVDQKHRNGKFDEHKVIMGAANEAQARQTYLQNYEQGWTGLGAITEMSLEDFKAWVMDASKTKKPAATKTAETATPDKAVYGAKNTLVSQSRADELRAKLREKAKNNMFGGLDTEMLAWGTELAVFHLEAGVRKFTDFAAAMASDLGTTPAKLRPYLRSWYNGARDMMEDHGLPVDGMDSPDQVRAELQNLADTPKTEESNDAGTAVHRAGPAPLEPVATRNDQGATGRGDAEPSRTDGQQGNRAPSGAADAAGDAEARSGGNGAARDDLVQAGARSGRGRERVSASDASKRKRAPKTPATAKELQAEAVEEIKQASPINVPGIDFTITDEVELGKGTEGVKYADNLKAIRTLKQIEQENRRATPEEQRILARYVGWGGLKNAFRVAGARTDGEEGIANGWKARVDELEALLTPAELRAARNSTTAAHYTSEAVVGGVWKGVQRLGFNGGAVLEPSVGTGNFLGLMPQSLRGKSKVFAVEYDSLTARIAQQLYPNQTILHTGFQNVPMPNGKFALAIGNPPFGKESLYFKHNPLLQGKSIHNQFFMQSLQSLDDGGVMGMVVSHNLMDAQDQSARLAMAIDAEFVGAIRLPETAFKENARTEVVTDILFFKKRSMADVRLANVAATKLRYGKLDTKALEALTSGMPEAQTSTNERVQAIVANMEQWVPSSRIANFAGSGETISLNPYFLTNPKMVLGTMDASGTMNGRADLNVRLANPADMARLMDEAIAQLPERAPMDAVAQRTMEQFEQMATAMRLAVNRADPGAVSRTPEGMLKIVLEMDDVSGSNAKPLLTELSLTADTPFSEEYTLRSDGKWQVQEDVLGEDGKPVKKVSKLGKVTNQNEKKITAYDSLANIPAKDKWGSKRIELITDMLPLRDGFKRQMMLEASDAPTKMMEDHRKRLADLYQGFVKKHGKLHKRDTEQVAMVMPDGALVLALENVAQDGSTSPADILSRRVTVPPKPVERVTNASEAVAVVLAETGSIDIERVAKLLGTDEEGAKAALSAGDKPRAFFDPETNQWEPSDGYLSGLVRRKLLAAKAAGLDANVRALDAVQPEPWDASQITPAIGSSWIPAQVYADFLKRLGFTSATVHYSQATNTFSVATKGQAAPDWRASDNALSTVEIVQRLLNSRAMKVLRVDADKKTYVDQEATAESQMKAGEIANEFLDWAFADDDRREQLVTIFNEKYNTRVQRQRDGSHLTLPGKVPDSVIKMRPWQLNAVWRGITDNAVLYDHAVGAGKTYTAIARAMERRRMGLSKKPMIVVPNHLVEQWAADVRKLYPGANILAGTKHDFEKQRRRRLFARIGAGDYDMVIVGHSSFGFIDIDPATEERYLDEELRIAYDAVKEAEEAAERDGFTGWGKPMGVAQAERLVKKLEERLAKIRDTKRDRLLTFEEMGIDDLTVDEAHEFKNLAYSSNLSGVSGMGNKTGSQKALDLNLKIRTLKEKQGTSVAFLTGTPISNSVAEMYLVLRNLMPAEMAELGFENFDAWRTNYVSATAAYEPTESGSLKEVTRLGREWSNMRSLMDLYYTVSDAVTLQDMKDDFARANPGKTFPVPKVRSQENGGSDREMVAIKPNEQQRAILRDIVNGFDSLGGITNPKDRNKERLRLMDRARKVSLDARAVDPNIAVPDGTGKIGAVVASAVKIYNQWEADKGTQLIFLDRSVPKAKGDDAVLKKYDKLVEDWNKASAKGDPQEVANIEEKLEKFDSNEINELRNAQKGGWNAYEEIKRQLVAQGIPAKEIRFVQEANTDDQKAELFRQVNAGEVRILLGSSPRMGAGTNVQERLVALHHVDVTWKPSDIEQREGRIVRQGNALLAKYGDEFTVDVIAYATEMTVDAKMWSLNATKLKSINGVRKYEGAFNMEFEDEESASMAEMAALATGNPLMVERVVLDGDIKKLEMAQRAYTRRVSGARGQMRQAQRTIEQGPVSAARLRTFAQQLETTMAGVRQRSDARKVTVNGVVFTSDLEADLAATTSIEAQQASAGKEKGRYVVEVNGEKATSRERIRDLIADQLGDKDFEAEVDGKKFISINSAVAAIMDKHGPASTRGREFTLDGITINGMRVELDIAPSRWKANTDSVLTLVVLDADGNSMVQVSHGYESPTLSAASLRAGLNKLAKEFAPELHLAQARDQEAAVERAKRDLPELKKLAEITFPQEQELKDKRDRLGEVEKALAGSSDAARLDGEVKPSATEEGDAAEEVAFSRGSEFAASPRRVEAVKLTQGVVDAMRAAWSNGPEVVVAYDMQDPVIPEAVRRADQQQRSGGAAGNPEGFYYKGKAYVLASQMRTPNDVSRVVAHEVLGHYGLRGMFGQDLGRILDQIATMRKEQVRAKTIEYGLRGVDKLSRRVAAEEVLAEMAQATPRLHFVQRAIAAIRTWLRKHVPGLQSIKLTDAEIINNYILPARAWVERGGPDGNGPRGGQRIEPVMSRAEASGATDSDNILFSRAKMAELKDKGLQMAHTYMTHPGKVSLWDKTVGTMRHISERYPAFKPVFEAAQQFIDDVASVANQAAQYAPRLIPRVETLSDLRKKPISVVDNRAIGKALFGGTLDWGRDQHGKAMPIDELKAKYAGLTVDQKAEVLLAAKKVDPRVMAMWRGKQLEQFEALINSKFDSSILKAGVAFNHKELRDFFGMNEQQISLYDEARATVDKSLDMTARAEMLRALGRDWDGFRDMVMDAPTLTDAWKLLDDELEQRAKAIPDSRDQMAAKMFQIRASHDKAQELMQHGYMPLQRFGKYTVDVVGPDGERIYFGMFESKADSNRMAETMKREYQGASVTQGTLNDQQYKLFAGITPETAELFGSMLGLDAAGNDAKDQAFQEFLKLSKNNHSALKRLIHRKGIAGYSEDVGRVLASFVYSNARLAATGLNAGKMETAINDLNTKHKHEGELGEIAAKLREYIQDPQEEGQAIRGMLFAQYLGGSIASAMVNMTQPFAVTLPWLSQFGGMAKASRYLSGALKDMATRGFKYDSELAHALKMAEDDGVVSPQEIHQLMAQARGAGGLRTGDGTKTGDARANAANVWEKAKVGWGQPFALAEQFNRRSTFIAAYRLAKEQGKDNPAEFARRAVVETQFLYTKANKPQWARGAIGGTLFTFKTYSVSFLELMQRTWNAGEAGSPERAAGRRAVGWAMLMLMLMGGAGGLPFVEDVEDLVDSAGQMMGYNTSVKQWRQQAMRDVLGAELADFLESGLSGLPGMPLDVSGRLGMGNLIPGTGLLLDKQSNARDVVELLGPAGDLVQRGLQGTKEIIKGAINADGAQMVRGAGQWAPNAVRNLAKGADMAASGMYKDSKGYKVIDTTLDEAILKAIGFQPRSVAEVQESNSFMQRSKSFYIQTSSDIKAKWAQALFEKDAAGVERARERVQEWNRKNPDQPIRINMPDIWKRVAQMGKDRTDRIADTAPKALRQQLRDMAQEQSR